MLDEGEKPAGTGLPLIVNTPGWVKGELISFPAINLKKFSLFLLFTLLQLISY